MLNPSINNILVRFDPAIDTPLGLAIPERYVVHQQSCEGDNETRMGVTTDRRLINPQVIEVIEGNGAYYENIKTNWPKEDADIELKNFTLIDPGQRAFVYYGAYEIAKWIRGVDKLGVIPANMVLFFIEPIKMMPGLYLCEEIDKNLPKTAHGIYTTPALEEKEPVRLKVLHLPDNSVLKEGDTVITVDSHQYPLRYKGKKYIKLAEHEIAGYIKDGEVYPFGTNLLVKYLENPEDAEITRYNDEITRQADFCRKHNWHIEGMSFEKKPLGKFTRAKVLRGEYADEQIMVYRGIGVDAGNGQTIIGKDALIGILEWDGQKHLSTS